MTKPELLIQYTYDALDKLASLNSDSSKRHRFYNSTRLATETQGATGYSIVQHDNFLLAQQKHEHNTPNTTLLATDLQRSVLQTLNKDTKRQAITYCPYGYPSAMSGLLSLLGFNGERPDPVTGHYWLGNGYRAFNPVLMRFNSPDRISPFGKGGLNSYAYCLGDPINRVDPNGEAPIWVFSKTARTITVFRELGHSSWNLKPNITNKVARRMVAKMNRAEVRIEKKSRAIADFVMLDKQDNYNPLPKPMTDLKTRAMNAILSDKEFDFTQLPQPLKDFKDFVDAQNKKLPKAFYKLITHTDNPYVITDSIDSLARGRLYDSSIDAPPPIIEFAHKYNERIFIMRQAVYNLSTKKLNILLSIRQ
ncbi:RHS repeat-associated core domain-containing protein [Pseudomonas sp. PDM31]|uniref:RHS repeat-associated core domain-containing protein n=1 Tax=Pseudomonas sp. PDM31 TaxID=2854778 RepID=UPI001C469095|nr:RHS repeat-associated core domain-containing protein [Pseudomonas sp. PDM31]MBV7476134.1 RHS repeat-associated core domain-containing protein [Pseudomonas sp. PDM31]